MILDNSQHSALCQMLNERATEIADLIAQGILATATHNRPSTINLVIKIGRNADDPLLIEVCSQRKIKAPKSKHSDLTSWDEVETLAGYRTDEEPGQERLPEVGS